MMDTEINYCNKCPSSIRGMCCYFSFFDGTENFLTYPCKWLRKRSRRCKIYKKRFKINPKCLTVDQGLKIGSFPKECPYVKKSNVVPVIPYKTYNREKLIIIK